MPTYDLGRARGTIEIDSSKATKGGEDSVKAVQGFEKALNTASDAERRAAKAAQEYERAVRAQQKAVLEVQKSEAALARLRSRKVPDDTAKRAAYQKELEAATTRVTQATGNLDKAEKNLITTHHNLERANENVSNSSGRMKQALTKNAGEIRRVGLVTTAAAGVVLAGFGLMVRSAASFEKRLSAVKAVSGATREEMDLLSKKALQLGKDTKFSAGEAAQAIEELVKAGVSVKDVLNGAADATVALAAAGEISLPEAATIASNAMNVFRLAAAQMPRVADLIAGAANASAIDVGEFAMSLQQAGAVANLVGLTFDDLAVAIAEMGNAGIRGSDAGTSLKTFLQNLIPVTDRQIDKMRELGLLAVDNGVALKKLAEQGIKPVSTSMEDVIEAIAQYLEKEQGLKVGSAKSMKASLAYAQALGVVRNQFFDTEGKAKSLADIQDLLARSTAHMTKEQKLATFELLFGSDAIRAASVLAQNGRKGFEDLAGSMDKVTAAQVAATRQGNLEGKLENFKGSAETLAITLGSVLLPAITKVVEFLTKIVNAFLGLPPGVQKAIVIIVGITAALVAFVGIVVTIVGAVAGAIATLGALATSLGILGGSGAALLGIITIIPVIIAAIVTLVYLIIKNWDTIKRATAAVFGAIGNLLKKIWNTIYGIVAGALRAVFKVVRSVLQAIAFLITAYVKIWAKVIQVGMAIIQTVFSAVFNVITNIVKTALDALVAAFRIPFEIIRAIVQIALALILTAFLLALNAIYAVVRPIFETIATVISAVMAGVRNTVVLYLNLMKAFWVGIFNFLVKPVVNAFAAVVRVISSALQTAQRVASNIISGIVSIISSIFSGAVRIFASIWNGMVGVMSGPFTRIKNIIIGILGVIKAIWNTTWNAIDTTFRNVWNGITGFVKGAINLLNKAINAIIRAVNAIHVSIPDIPGVPGRGKRIGFNITPVPELAKGGVFFGPALLAEGGVPEAAIPLEGRGAELVASALARHLRSLAGSGGDTNINTVINNPIAERGSDSQAKQLRRYAALGLVGSGGRVNAA